MSGKKGMKKKFKETNTGSGLYLNIEYMNNEKTKNEKNNWYPSKDNPIFLENVIK